MRYLLFCYYSRYESLQPQLLARALQRHQGHRLILTSHPNGMPCYDCFIVKLGAHLVCLFYNIIDLLIRDITCVVEFHISFCSAVDYCLDGLLIFNFTLDGDSNDEFRHPSWKTEGNHRFISKKMQFLSDVAITADHSFIRFHGRNTKNHYWYNYLYSKQELEPWIDKVNQIKNQTKVLRVYFNNHYGGKAVANALQFKEMTGTSLTQLELRALKHAESEFLNSINALLITIF